MRWLLPSFILFGCSHPAPPVQKPEVPIGNLDDLKGTYTGGNDLDWGFFLTLDGDKFELTIDRGKIGRCVQRGAIVAGEDKRTFSVTLAKDECNPDHIAGQKLTLHVDSFTGDELVLATKGEGVDDHRTYARKKSPK